MISQNEYNNQCPILGNNQGQDMQSAVLPCFPALPTQMTASGAAGVWDNNGEDNTDHTGVVSCYSCVYLVTTVSNQAIVTCYTDICIL